MPDPRRLFIVRAAGRKIVAMASDFDVRHENGLVSLLLINGSASLQAVSPGGQAQVVRSGERLITGGLEAAQLDRPNLAPLLAWRTGRAIFRE